MLTDITIGQFFPGASALHRMDPRAKLLLLLVLMAAIFVFDTPEAWEGFVRSSGWKASGAATAVASDGVNGDSFEGAVMAGDGIWVYQLTTKGLALELAIKGTRIYPDKDLNDWSKH